MSDRIYLDYNASTPVAPEVADAMEPFIRDHYGNPHTKHWAGRPGGEAMVRARAQVAALIGCKPHELIFTSGASESNNHAIKGVFLANRGRRDHIVSSAIEHPSVRRPIEYLVSRFDAKVTWLPVDPFGRVSPDDVRRAITPRTCLISVMHANNEVGTIQPIGEIGAIAREAHIPLHSDAAQSVGKVAVNVDDLGVTLMSLAGHKLYAPKGIGALYIRDGFVDVDALIHGAGQERDLRSGTENVEFIVGLGKACEIAARDIGMPRVRALRDKFWDLLQAAFGVDVALHGHPTERLPNTLNVGFRDQIGGALLEKLTGVAATTGSACHAGGAMLSSTLKAMNVPTATGFGAIRFSLGRETTAAQIERVVEKLRSALAANRDANIAT
ncbi:MAG: cysteine desulfurase [Phycisphaerales bacterium]|nr:cysteine desulfurase [Phycisphaerales bacterium]